jgi:hypothetical protein
MDYNKEFGLADIYYFCDFDLVWKTEQWRDIVGYENKYHISDLGRVKSLKYHRGNNHKILKTNNATFGYKNVCLSINKVRKTFAVHILVGVAFLGHNPGGYKLVINHKNFKPWINCVSNLEIVTQRENANLKHKKSSSQYVGVCLKKPSYKWQARIVINRKRINLGTFINEIDAHNAYQKALSEIK